MTPTTIDTLVGSATMLDQETRGEQHAGNGPVRSSTIKNGRSGIGGVGSAVKASGVVSHSMARSKRRFVMRKH